MLSKVQRYAFSKLRSKAQTMQLFEKHNFWLDSAGTWYLINLDHEGFPAHQPSPTRFSKLRFLETFRGATNMNDYLAMAVGCILTFIVPSLMLRRMQVWWYYVVVLAIEIVRVRVRARLGVRARWYSISVSKRSTSRTSSDSNNLDTVSS